MILKKEINYGSNIAKNYRVGYQVPVKTSLLIVLWLEGLTANLKDQVIQICLVGRKKT